MSTKSKARTAASGMGRRAHRQGAGHGAAQLTFDDEEAEDDREEEGGLHTGGARTHLACCGRLRANPIQLQLPRKRSRCWHVAWRLLPCHVVKVGRAVLNTAAEAWLMTKKATALQLADG